MLAAESHESSQETAMLVLRSKPSCIQHAAGMFPESDATMGSHQGLLQSYGARHDHVLPRASSYHQAT